MQTVSIARNTRTVRDSRATFDDMTEDHANPFNPFASDARAHDSQDFARDAFDCFSLSIDTLL